MEKRGRKEESPDGEHRVLWDELRVSLGGFPDGSVATTLSHVLFTPITFGKSFILLSFL